MIDKIDNITKNITLIGMPGSGKSTLGVLLAKRLKMDFLDSDILIQKEYKKSLSQLIEEHGNDGFVQIENDVNAGISCNDTVIAPGGSIVYCEGAMEHLKKISTIIYLSYSYKEIEQRLGDLKSRGVVLKENQSLLDLYNERVELYQKWADLTAILSEDSLQRASSKVIALLKENNYIC